MIKPEEARKIADVMNEHEQDMKNWNWLDEIQFKSILRRIEYWAKKGGKHFYLEQVRIRVRKKLEKEGYAITHHGSLGDMIDWYEPETREIYYKRLGI